MKTTLLIVSGIVVLLSGCTTPLEISRVEGDLRKVMNEAFLAENSVEILKLDPQERHYEKLRWSVTYDDYLDRTTPLIKKMDKHYETADLVNRLQDFAAETGCSGVFLYATKIGAPGVDFDFYESSAGQLNAKYHYSRRFLDTKLLYPDRLPIRPWNGSEGAIGGMVTSPHAIAPPKQLPPPQRSR